MHTARKNYRRAKHFFALIHSQHLYIPKLKLKEHMSFCLTGKKDIIGKLLTCNVPERLLNTKE